jgi:hypothetical protein
MYETFGGSGKSAYHPAITAEKGLGFVRKFGNETITINVGEEPWSKVLGDFI